MTFCDMNIEERFIGSRSIAEEKSQQNSAIPASRILRIAVFSHSFNALSPTNTNFSVSRKLSARISTALSVFSLSANSLYAMPSYAIPFSSNALLKFR